MRKGEVAPYDGVVLTYPLSAFLQASIEMCDKECEADLTWTSSVATVNREADAKVAEVEKGAAYDRGFAKGKEKGREEAEPSILAHPLMVAGLTAVVLVGTFFAVKAASNAIDKATQ